MNQHWTDEQMSSWILGERSVEMAGHIAACDACRRELAAMQGGLDAYRSDVQHTAAADEYRWMRIRAGVAGRSVYPAHSGLRWALTSALAVLALSASLLVTPHAHSPVAQQAPMPMSDEQLLNEIQDDLSRSAPEALAPAETLQQERAQLLAQSQSQQSDRRER